MANTKSKKEIVKIEDNSEKIAKLFSSQIPSGLLGVKAEQNRTKADDFLSVYANNIAVSISSWDMQVVFGRVLSPNNVMEHAEIVMSKELAKALTIIMSTHLKAYEAQFGEIQIPDLAKLVQSEIR